MCQMWHRGEPDRLKGGPVDEAGSGDGSTQRPIRVLIVDDHKIVASSIAFTIDATPDLRCVGTASSLEQARAMVATTAPDVMLLDHRLPDGDGVAAIPELLGLRSSMRIVVVTASAADQLLLQAIEGGASGFVSKARDLDELTAAVRAAASGESVISPELLARLLPRMRRGGGSVADSADPARGGGPAAGRRRTLQPGDRRAARRQRAHRAQPRRQPVGQARRPLQAGGALHRDPGRPAARPVSGPGARAAPRAHGAAVPLH